MRTSLLLVVAVFAAFPAVVLSQTTQPASARQVDALIQELRRVVPEEYIVGMAPLEIPVNTYGNAPYLIISTRKPVPAMEVILNGPGAAANDSKTQLFQHVSRIWAMRPYVPPDRFPFIRAENDRLEHQRLEFEKRLISLGIEGGQGMGPAPLGPSSFRPRTPEQRGLVNEYRLLWLQTEPQRLPTHHYAGLSFEEELPRWAFTDEQQGIRFGEVIQKVEAILRPYQPR